MRYTTMIGGLVLGALPVVASAHEGCGVRVGFPTPRIAIGCGHHEVFRGCLPSVRVGGSFTCAPVVVAAPEVVVAAPEVVYTAPVVYSTPVVYTTPVYFGGGVRIYERSHCVPVRHCR